MNLYTHQHFWKANPGDYHWMRPAVPILARDYLPSDLRPKFRKAGVARTVLVQAAQTADEISEETARLRLTTYRLMYTVLIFTNSWMPKLESSRP
jgi:predicted TIM-barrel fold metal-dependent hydrolase